MVFVRSRVSVHGTSGVARISRGRYDGCSSLINIHWMEPRDVLLSELSMKINDRSKRRLSSYHGGACIAHADGSVELLDRRNDTDPA